MVTRDQAFLFRLIQLCGDRRYRQAGAFHKQRERKSFRQAERIEHELKRQICVRNRFDFLRGVAQCGPIHERRRLLEARFAGDAVRERNLAMRAGADADVVAEPPVIQVVTRFETGFSIGGGLIVFITGRLEPGFDHQLHVGREVIIRQRRRKAVEQGVGFQREMVNR